MDLHVAIIADVAQVFRELGHEVVVESLSAHAWTMGHETAKVPGLLAPNPVNRLLGRKSFLDIDQDMCDKFYEKNKERLSQFDGFIVSYPPAFALLFERFNKPVITISCTRFDFPCTESSRLEWLVNGLTRMQNGGNLVAVANNLLDAEVCNTYFDFEWKHIPSLCNYMGRKYEPSLPDLLVWSRDAEKLEGEVKSLKGVNKEFSMSQKYDREVIRTHGGTVHLPYQVSIMSAFEHYAQAIPMFVPAPGYLRDLAENHGLLHEVLFPKSTLALPENYVELADFFDESNFRHVIQFDSLEDLQEKIESTNLDEVSQNMRRHHFTRTEQVHGLWSKTIREIH